MNKAKVMRFNIYKYLGSNSSNGGISSKFDNILVLCDRGLFDVDLDNPPENLCKIVKRNLSGNDKPYVHIEPYAPVNKGSVGWMYGGCIIDYSDTRFRELVGVSYPVHLHDRQETQAEYDTLSR